VSYFSWSSAGRSRWWSRMPRSVVQNGVRRAELWATSKRSNGSRVHSNLSAWRTRLVSGTSSTVKRPSLITAFVNSGLRTVRRPISARNCISRKDTGDTPQGRYWSIQGNFAIRFEPRTSQIKKCVSRRSVNVRSAAKRHCLQPLATPTTTDRLDRHSVRAEDFCSGAFLSRFFSHSILPGGERAGDLCVEPRSPRHPGLRRAAETNAFWLQMH